LRWCAARRPPAAAAVRVVAERAEEARAAAARAYLRRGTSQSWRRAKMAARKEGGAQAMDSATIDRGERVVAEPQT